MVLSKMRNAARVLLTLDEKDPKRIFEGQALMRRMYKYGLLQPEQDKLDYVLALSPQEFLERRLETLVFKLGLAKSIHHARVLIRQRHIRWARALATCGTAGLQHTCSAGTSAVMLLRAGPRCCRSCDAATTTTCYCKQDDLVPCYQHTCCFPDSVSVTAKHRTAGSEPEKPWQAPLTDSSISCSSSLPAAQITKQHGAVSFLPATLASMDLVCQLARSRRCRCSGCVTPSGTHHTSIALLRQ
jgi:hypothetical protein